LNAGEHLSDREMVNLISAYQFLFNERLQSLFDQCHDSLWKTFERSRESDNLLTLFRHSSLYWRLRGKDAKEVPYIKKLSKIIGNSISDRRFSNLDREAAYYLIRSNSQNLPPLTTNSIEAPARGA
jgi:hypothetical protein